MFPNGYVMLLCYDGTIKGFNLSEKGENMVIKCERDKYGMRLEEFESINLVKSNIENVFHVAVLSYFRVNHETLLSANLRVFSVKFDEGEVHKSDLFCIDLTKQRMDIIKCLSMWEETTSDGSTILNLITLSKENRSQLYKVSLSYDPNTQVYEQIAEQKIRTKIY